ncbi:hypothetical protein F5Y09DRAFT_345238 [Xylaria sp. FL1042]|nr:hypothetical protein F5Y09DRAFT_345238 [Xylaria sp. FL1042]
MLAGDVFMTGCHVTEHHTNQCFQDRTPSQMGYATGNRADYLLYSNRWVDDSTKIHTTQRNAFSFDYNPFDNTMPTLDSPLEGVNMEHTLVNDASGQQPSMVSPPSPRAPVTAQTSIQNGQVNQSTGEFLSEDFNFDMFTDISNAYPGVSGISNGAEMGVNPQDLPYPIYPAGYVEYGYPGPSTTPVYFGNQLQFSIPHHYASTALEDFGTGPYGSTGWTTTPGYFGTQSQVPTHHHPMSTAQGAFNGGPYSSTGWGPTPGYLGSQFDAFTPHYSMSSTPGTFGAAPYSNMRSTQQPGWAPGTFQTQQQSFTNTGNGFTSTFGLAPAPTNSAPNYPYQPDFGFRNDFTGERLPQQFSDYAYQPDFSLPNEFTGERRPPQQSLKRPRASQQQYLPKTKRSKTETNPMKALLDAQVAMWAASNYGSDVADHGSDGDSVSDLETSDSESGECEVYDISSPGVQVLLHAPGSTTTRPGDAANTTSTAGGMKK